METVFLFSVISTTEDCCKFCKSFTFEREAHNISVISYFDYLFCL